MDKIARIRQKIKELRELLEDHNYYLDNSEQALGYGFALDDIEQFLNALSEEPDKSLEEAAEEYARLDDKGVWKDGGKYKGFKAGAEWQEKQDLRWAGEIHKNGYNLCKEQMLKDAVEVRVKTSSLNGPLGISAYCCNFPSEHPLYRCKEGDKVRIVVLKEEEE